MGFSKFYLFSYKLFLLKFEFFYILIRNVCMLVCVYFTVIKNDLNIKLIHYFFLRFHMNNKEYF